jgi:hypothetical protein
MCLKAMSPKGSSQAISCGGSRDCGCRIQFRLHGKPQIDMKLYASIQNLSIHVQSTSLIISMFAMVYSLVHYKAFSAIAGIDYLLALCYIG